MSAVSCYAEDADKAINPDRPGTSNSSFTVDKGRLQVESGFAFQTDKGEDRTLYTVPLTLRYGLSNNLEIRVDSDFLSLQGSESGIADLSPGIKWNFSPGNPSFGLLAGARTDTGSNNFKGKGTEPYLILAANIDSAAGSDLEINIGTARRIDSDSNERFFQWTFAATYTIPLTEKLQGFAELASIGPDMADGIYVTTIDGGLAYLINKDMQIDFDVMKGLSSRGVDLFGTCGISVRF